jgi:hypothetical protein
MEKNHKESRRRASRVIRHWKFTITFVPAPLAYYFLTSQLCLVMWNSTSVPRLCVGHCMCMGWDRYKDDGDLGVFLKILTWTSGKGL